MIRIQRIERDSPLYAQERELRERVLLGPIGLDLNWFDRNYPGCDVSAEHFVAVVEAVPGQRVVGCALLVPAHPGAGQLMQMAVDPQRQGEGIGRRLVVAVESRAFGPLGLRELFCHARSGSEGFYRRLGWLAEGEPFVEAGVPHLRMVLRPEEQAWSPAQP